MDDDAPSDVNSQYGAQRAKGIGHSPEFLPGDYVDENFGKKHLCLYGVLSIVCAILASILLYIALPMPGPFFPMILSVFAYIGIVQIGFPPRHIRNTREWFASQIIFGTGYFLVVLVTQHWLAPLLMIPLYLLFALVYSIGFIVHQSRDAELAVPPADSLCRDDSISRRLRLAFFSDPHVTTAQKTIEKNKPGTDNLCKVVQFALTNHPDSMVIAGDLTDDGNVSSWLLAVSKLQETLISAGRLDLTIVIAPGNHDITPAFGTSHAGDRLFRYLCVAGAFCPSMTTASRMDQPIALTLRDEFGKAGIDYSEWHRAEVARVAGDRIAKITSMADKTGQYVAPRTYDDLIDNVASHLVQRSSEHYKNAVSFYNRLNQLFENAATLNLDSVLLSDTQKQQLPHPPQLIYDKFCAGLIECWDELFPLVYVDKAHSTIYAVINSVSNELKIGDNAIVPDVASQMSKLGNLLHRLDEKVSWNVIIVAHGCPFHRGDERWWTKWKTFKERLFLSSAQQTWGTVLSSIKRGELTKGINSTSWRIALLCGHRHTAYTGQLGLVVVLESSAVIDSATGWLCDLYESDLRPMGAAKLDAE